LRDGEGWRAFVFGTCGEGSVFSECFVLCGLICLVDVELDWELPQGETGSYLCEPSGLDGIVVWVWDGGDAQVGHEASDGIGLCPAWFDIPRRKWVEEELVALRDAVRYAGV
jgi:hypothetical protein